ncbi:IPT/TIG domain-containing protein [Dyella flagellata]|uniref:IPT/TIG domain-containing protein n=1 Tax=Dyella flagellata TaxID=1867833 RepID=A0ABQ5XIH4_9GAMM|nr:IPT/TIG domain-containing protein [Dyella flagellata]GLQ90969.1 hypothetical protein GCM10007898_45450 [Dyella flagellata]
MCSVVLGLGEAGAQSTHYVYDANGRVVAVTASNGTSVQYSYNTLGHTSQVSAPLSPGQLAIFAFSPAHGEAATQVTLQGQGFNSNAANDTVSFNGTVASILSASTTQLVTTVPSGATSGPISVTVGTQTATSPAPFVIDDTGLPPVITQVSPAVAAVGGTVTVVGTHLDPVAGDAAAQIGGQAISAFAVASDTQLQFAIPNHAVTGYVTVTTPYGSAISPTPVGVLPPSVSASNVVSSGVATVNGSSVNLNIGAAAQMGAVVFTAPQGGWASLQASGINSSATSIGYTVYAPGNGVVQQGSISSVSPSIHMPHLTAGASYLVIVQSNGGSTQMALGVEADATLVAPSAITIATTTSGQSKRLLVPSTMMSGVSLEFALSNITVTGGGSSEVDVYTYDATGAQVNLTQCKPASCRDYLWGMAAGGTWSLVIVPDIGGVMSFNMTLYPPVTGPLLTANAPSTPINLGTGQFEYVTFNATAGQPVTLMMSNLSTTPAGQSAYVAIYSPNTAVMTPNNFYTYVDANATPVVNIASLPASGTYTIGIDTPLGVPMSGTLTLVPAVVDTLPTNGTVRSYSANAPGQGIYLNFAANAGDNLELALNHIAVAGDSTGTLNVNVYNSAGTLVKDGNATCRGTDPGSSCRLLLWGLAAGNYSIIVSPANGGTMSFSTLLQPPVMGPLLTTNSPVSVNLGAGQFEQLTFNATAGQPVTLNMSGVSTTPSGQPVYVGVYRPDVGTMTPENYYTYFDANQTQTINLPGLPVSGTYTLIVNNPLGLPASGSLSLVRSVGGTLPNGAAGQSYSTTVTGQNIALNFSANAGDNLELGLNNIVANGSSSGAVNISVYNPAGTQIVSDTCYSSTPGASCRELLWGLIAGNYSIIVSPANGGTMSFNATLQPAVMGPLLTLNNPVSVTLGSGQFEQLTFNATAGQSVTVSMTGVTTTPLGQRLYVGVYRPDVGQMTPNNYYNYFDANSAPSMSLPNLPVSGTYTLIVNNPMGLPASGQLSISSP